MVEFKTIKINNYMKSMVSYLSKPGPRVRTEIEILARITFQRNRFEHIKIPKIHDYLKKINC